MKVCHCTLPSLHPNSCERCLIVGGDDSREFFKSLEGPMPGPTPPEIFKLTKEQEKYFSEHLCISVWGGS